MSNSDNPKNGADFQRQVLEWFRKNYDSDFELEKKIPIGNPAKDHKFDIVDTSGTIAIECKRYTWTETGNVPSAKMGFTNEAAFYLSFLPETYEKYIVMLKSHHPKGQRAWRSIITERTGICWGRQKWPNLIRNRTSFESLDRTPSIRMENIYRLFATFWNRRDLDITLH